MSMNTRDLVVLAGAVHTDETFGQQTPWVSDKGEGEACKRLVRAGFLTVIPPGGFNMPPRYYVNEKGRAMVFRLITQMERS